MRTKLISLFSLIGLCAFLLSCSDSNSSEEVSYCLISDTQGKSIICIKMTGYLYTQEGCEGEASEFTGATTASIPTECPEGNVLETCEDYNDDEGITWEVNAYSAEGVRYCSDF